MRPAPGRAMPSPMPVEIKRRLPVCAAPACGIEKKNTYSPALLHRQLETRRAPSPDGGIRLFIYSGGGVAIFRLAADVAVQRRAPWWLHERMPPVMRINSAIPGHGGCSDSALRAARLNDIRVFVHRAPESSLQCRRSISVLRHAAFRLHGEIALPCIPRRWQRLCRRLFLPALPAILVNKHIEPESWRKRITAAWPIIGEAIANAMAS